LTPQACLKFRLKKFSGVIILLFSRVDFGSMPQEWRAIK